MDFQGYKQWDLSTITKDDIPKTWGVYAFLNKENFTVEYIGRAVGINGLRGRIWSQHLNPKYLEPRESVFSKTGKDLAQINKGIKINGRICIEKSVFRKNVARANDLSPGSNCLSFVLSQFLLVFIAMEESSKEKVLQTEYRLIELYKPFYNEY